MAESPNRENPQPPPSRPVDQPLSLEQRRDLQSALEAAPEDVELNRHAAKSLAAAGRFQDAIRCWQRVEQADPRDAEAPRMISLLTLERSRFQGEEEPVEEAAEDDDSSETKAKAPAAAKAPRKLVLTHRQQLEQAIRQNPEEEENYLQLAERLLEENRIYEAQQTLIKATGVSSDLRIIERLEDINILRAQENVAIARQKAAEEKASDAFGLVEQLQNEAQRLELDIYRARCDRYPEDNSLKYELGMRLKGIGNLRAALNPLRAGLETEEHRASASLEIGEILQRYHQFPKALQCYRQAAQLSAGREQEANLRKQALYRAGVLAESMQLNDSAQQYFAELVRVDAEYKDASARLDKLLEIDQNS